MRIVYIFVQSSHSGNCHWRALALLDHLDETQVSLKPEQKGELKTLMTLLLFSSKSLKTFLKNKSMNTKITRQQYELKITHAFHYTLNSNV